MKQVFESGDIKEHSFFVTNNDVARFEKQDVHPVCATFTLAREIEWCTRLFVLDMLEPTEEGIGTRLLINHQSPALVNDKVLITSKIISIINNEINCSFIATVNDRIIAKGETSQKILSKEKINTIFKHLN